MQENRKLLLSEVNDVKEKRRHENDNNNKNIHIAFVKEKLSTFA